MRRPASPRPARLRLRTRYLQARGPTVTVSPGRQIEDVGMDDRDTGEGLPGPASSTRFCPQVGSGLCMALRARVVVGEP